MHGGGQHGGPLLGGGGGGGPAKETAAKATKNTVNNKKRKFILTFSKAPKNAESEDNTFIFNLQSLIFNVLGYFCLILKTCKTKKKR